jgi:hypothetical protein
MNDHYWHNGGSGGLFVRAGLRTLQFVLAAMVAGLYGIDLKHATTEHTRAGTEWVYAEVVACLSMLTCIVHCFVTVKRVAWCTWDWVLMVLWAALTGVFGTMYIGDKKLLDDGTKLTLSITRMKIAVWIDLISMMLWLATAVLGITWCISTRRVTRRTGMIISIPRDETRGTDSMMPDALFESSSSHGSDEKELSDFKKSNRESV